MLEEMTAAAEVASSGTAKAVVEAAVQGGLQVQIDFAAAAAEAVAAAGILEGTGSEQEIVVLEYCSGV